MPNSPRRALILVVAICVPSLLLSSCSNQSEQARLKAEAEAARREAETAKREAEARINNAKAEGDYSPSVTKSVSVTYDKGSIRFLDDQLVIDLVFASRIPHNLQDVKVKINCPAENGHGEWKKEVQVPWWPSGKEERVIVPLLNNDLDIEEREKDIGPSFEYSLSGSYQANGIMRTVSAADPEGPVRMVKLRLPGIGTPPVRDSWTNTLTGTVSQRHGEATMALKVKRLDNELPSLVQVQMLVVGYTETGELFRKKVTRDSWLDSEEWVIEVPAGEAVRYRFRGVGKRRTTTADDLNKQQVYYICENWKMKSAK